MLSKLVFALVGDGDEASITGAIIGADGATPFVALSSHPGFRAIVDFCRDRQEHDGKVNEFEAETLLSLLDTDKAVVAQLTQFAQLTDRIALGDDGELYLDAEPVHGTVVENIKKQLAQGINNPTPLLRFIERMSANPNPESVEQLYNWFTAAGLTLDTDGRIVGYKGVAKTASGAFESVNRGRAIVDGVVYNGAIPNYLGAVVEMPRSEVEFNPAVGCSTGLHVGSYDYASGWARGALLEVRVDPADVVSVPTDCSAQKMRCRRYEVIGTIDQPYTAGVIGDDVDEYGAGDLWGDFEWDEDDEFSDIW